MSTETRSTPEFRGNMPRPLDEVAAWTAGRLEEAIDPELPIIDPHHHLWHDDRGRYLLDELLADLNSGHNIVATVFLQAKSMYRRDGPEAMKPVGEVEFANGMAAACASGQYGGARICEAIVGHADLRTPDVEAVLEALAAAGNGRLRGIRHGATWDDGSAAYGRSFSPRYMLADPAFRQGYAALRRHGLSFEAWIYHTQLAELGSLLRACPDIPVVLNHVGGVLGIPPYIDRQEVFESWRARLRELAVFPNLYVKVGGLGMLYCGCDFHTRPLPPSSMELATAWRPYIETCIELFGAERCMFESNFPVDKQSCGYGVLWNAFKRVAAGYGDAEKASLFHDTAAGFYRLRRS